METLGSYLLQMACWLAGFWLVYAAFLKKETFFELNRWFLLIGLVASMVMPLFPVRYDVVREPIDFSTLKIVGQVATAEVSEGFSASDYLIIGYAFGVLFFLLRFVWQIAKLRRLRHHSESVEFGSTQLIKLEKDTAPFSFFRTIYVSKKLCGETELKTVIAHEKVHIDQRHWADLLLLEVARALQWFNPLLMIYRKAVMQNHEYLADSGTLRNGVSARTYKAVLANQMLGVPVLQVANGFTLFNPTKRILMMNKDKTTPVKRLKLLWALPVIALLLVSFAKPNYVSGENPNQATALSNPVSVKGKIFDQWGKPVPGALVSANGSSQQTVSDDDGKFLIAGIMSISDINVSKEGYSVVNKIEKSESEVFVLTMKHSPHNKQTKTITVKGKVTDENGKPLPGTSIVVKNSSTGTVSDAQGNYTLMGIKPDDEIVFSFVGYGTKVVKAASKLNVSMSKEVVVIGYANNQMAPPPPPPPPSAIRSKDGGKPLFVIDGNSNVDPNTIDPNTISSIEVLKDQSAIATYGDKAKDGVILITTKKENAPPPPPPSANDEVFVVVEDVPEFPGGLEALSKYINQKATEANEEGFAEVRFLVDNDGLVKDVKAVSTESDKLNKLATGIIAGFPKWKPGMQRGKAVPVMMQIGIDFGSKCITTKHKFMNEK